jgi:hypothetical protein
MSASTVDLLQMKLNNLRNRYSRLDSLGIEGSSPTRRAQVSQPIRTNDPPKAQAPQYREVPQREVSIIQTGHAYAPTIQREPTSPISDVQPGPRSQVAPDQKELLQKLCVDEAMKEAGVVVVNEINPTALNTALSPERLASPIAKKAATPFQQDSVVRYVENPARGAQQTPKSASGRPRAPETPNDHLWSLLGKSGPLSADEQSTLLRAAEGAYGEIRNPAASSERLPSSLHIRGPKTPNQVMQQISWRMQNLHTLHKQF